MFDKKLWMAQYRARASYKKYMATYRKEHRRKLTKQDLLSQKRRRKANPIPFREREKKYRARHPLKIRARTMVYDHIKAGKLTRPETCSVCYNIGRIEAHHLDYTKPLLIVWLCKRCHQDKT